MAETKKKAEEAKAEEVVAKKKYDEAAQEVEVAKKEVEAKELEIEKLQDEISTLEQEVATAQHQVDNLKKLLAGADPDDGTEVIEAKLKKGEAELNAKQAELAKNKQNLKNFLTALILKVRLRMN
ncbi:pspA [Streptococcus pneumoniae GA47368]|nr:pspA [Streptococcus pneumoniae GA47368]